LLVGIHAKIADIGVFRLNIHWIYRQRRSWAGTSLERAPSHARALVGSEAVPVPDLVGKTSI
jgi:hypothetical protein